MAKKDIRVETILEWDKYKDKGLSEAIYSIYSTVNKDVSKHTTWYWGNINTKRLTSWWIRGATIFMLGLGTLLPVYSGMSALPDDKLLLTQLGVISLLLGGLLHTADKIFGWSSGWIRYISTAISMEHKAKKFEIDWANYIIEKDGKLSVSDVKPLLNLAAQLQNDLSRLQAEETEAWKTEFNMGTALLGDLIKSQREAIESAKADQKIAADAAQRSGSIEALLSYKNGTPFQISISLDNEKPEDIIATSWSRTEVKSGHHRIRIVTNTTPIPTTTERVVDIKPGAITSINISLP